MSSEFYYPVYDRQGDRLGVLEVDSRFEALIHTGCSQLSIEVGSYRNHYHRADFRVEIVINRVVGRSITHHVLILATPLTDLPPVRTWLSDRRSSDDAEIDDALRKHFLES